MEPRNVAKLIFAIIILVLAIFGVIWLAGFLFFLFSKANPLHADFSTWFTYWNYYQDDPIIAKRLKTSLIIAAIAGFGIPIAALVAALRDIKHLHGNARFANNSEIRNAGLLGTTGIIIGKWKKRFLMFPGMQFVLLAAPTRSGKGIGIVIPNLLNWNESVIVNDVKLENYLITSSYRKQNGHEVFLFNPFCISEDKEGNPLDGKSHRYNPLGYISDDQNLRITDILAIGYSLYPGEGRDAFFDDTARNLFLGLTLYLCETPTLPRTIGELLRQSSGKGQPVKNYLQGIINERNYRQIEEVNKETGESITTLMPITEWDGKGLPPLSNECVDAIYRFTSTSENTLSSIMATFNAPLTMWASPIIDAATSTNDFDLRDVRKKRISIYLGIPANKLAEARILINLFYTQLVNLNTNQLLGATPSLKYQCLMLADEFTAPGRIGIIDKANSYMAGYGLRLLTMIQSLGQLEAEAPKGYGRENARTFMTNHACQIFYTPREQRDANEYSEALGYTTVHSKNRSEGRNGSSVSQAQGDGAGQKRALMLPQELKEMSQRQQIISIENTKPIKAEKIAYYSDPIFIDRLKSISPTLAALGRKLPSKKQLEDTWGSGELAAPVPILDLELHEAVIQAKVREMTPADVKQGIDLRKLTINTSALQIQSGEDGLEPEKVEDFVNGFFDALDDVNDYEDEINDDEIEEHPNNAELITLGNKNTVNIPDISSDASETERTNTGKALPIGSIDKEELDLISDEELIAMMDTAITGDDYFQDDDEIIEAMDSFEELMLLDEQETDDVVLDLSILDKPIT